MTEEKIKTDKEAASGGSGEKEELHNEDKTTVSSASPDEANVRMVNRIFDLDEKESRKYESRIKDILDWAKENSKGKSAEDLSWAIRSLETKTGTPPMGEKRINFIHRYIYLLSERDKIDEDISRYERNK